MKLSSLIGICVSVFMYLHDVRVLIVLARYRYNNPFDPTHDWDLGMYWVRSMGWIVAVFICGLFYYAYNKEEADARKAREK